LHAAGQEPRVRSDSPDDEGFVGAAEDRRPVDDPLLCGLHAREIGNAWPTSAPSRACDARHRRVGSRLEVNMLPLLLWILGVPGLIIILLLLLGLIHI
jgi:hypothetical protein